MYFVHTVFANSGFKRTLCGSKWDTLTGITNAFHSLGIGSTARHGCCPASKYMSSPEEDPFVEADSCSACPVGTFTSIPNDETSCQKCASGMCSAAGSATCAPCSKMPDDCLGISWTDRSCDPRKAVDDWIAEGTLKDSVVATYGPIRNWDMSQVTDMSYLFYQKRTLNADLSNWKVSNVVTLYESK